MSVANVGSALGASTTTTSFSITLPATQAGDVIILEFCHRGTGNGTVGGTSGLAFTLKHGQTFGSFSGKTYYARATGNHSGQTVTVSGLTNSCAGIVTIYRGALLSGDPLAAATVVGESNASGDETQAEITTTVDHAMVVLVVANSPDVFVTSPACTSPGALSIEAERLSTGGTDSSIMHASAEKSAAGATGAFTWSQTNGASGSWAYAIQPQPLAINQRAFQFYEDDGSDTTASAIASENVGITRALGAPFHLRIGLEETNGGGGFITDDYQLQFRVNGGGWSNVGGRADSVNVRAFDSANLTDNFALATQRLSSGSGSFQVGEIDTLDGLITGRSMNDLAFVEYLFAVDLWAGGTLVADDVIDFRLLRNAGALEAYAVTPTVTVAGGSGPTVVEGAGSSAGAGTAAAAAARVLPAASSSAGAASASGAGVVVLAVSGSAAGAATAAGSGEAVDGGGGSIIEGAGTSAGAATASAAASATAQAAATAPGSATASASAAAIRTASGATSGAAAAAAVAVAVGAMTGASAGGATAAAGGGARASAAASAAGAGAAAGTAAAIKPAAGAAAGAASAQGSMIDASEPVVVEGAGVAIGSSSSSASGGAVAQAAGIASGVAAAIAAGADATVPERSGAGFLNGPRRKRPAWTPGRVVIPEAWKEDDDEEEKKKKKRPARVVAAGAAARGGSVAAASGGSVAAMSMCVVKRAARARGAGFEDWSAHNARMAKLALVADAV